MDKKKELRKIIDDFEGRKISDQDAVDQIRNITGKTIDVSYLTSYWRSEDEASFITKLLTASIADWQMIDDERALVLIGQMIDDPGNDAILERNSEALERRFQKPEGTVIDLIFQEDIQDAKVILDKLKQERQITL